jgi:hypothetical protein
LAALALLGSTITPAMADEWNKETRLEVTQPLEIPGKVLTPGTYIFKLADSDADRKIVEVFSEDANGKQTFVTTILAISAYSVDTPDKPIIRLQERSSGQPEAIHTWFYPGNNTGWEFVYPKSERLEASSNQAPTEQLAPTVAVTPTLWEPPVEILAAEPLTEAQVEESLVIAQEETPVLVPGTADDSQIYADRTLPETAGYSATELMAGVAMLGLGLMIVFVRLRRTEA